MSLSNNHSNCNCDVCERILGMGDPKERRNRRYDEYHRSQIALLDTGKFSDFLITCQDKKWNVHKAIVCTQSAFFDGATRFGKEAAENKVDLPEDEPEIVDYMLKFMYGCDYQTPDPPEADKLCVDFDWVECHDGLSRIIRRKMMEGISSLNAEGMKRLVDFVKAEFPNLEPDGTNTLWLNSLWLSKNVRDALSRLFEDGHLTEGDKFYDLGWWSRLVIHGKLYCIGDKYEVEGLQEVALAKLMADKCPHAFAHSQIYGAFRILLNNTPGSDHAIRHFITQCLFLDMLTFGVRPCAQSLLEEYPELAPVLLRAAISDDSSWPVDH